MLPAGVRRVGSIEGDVSRGDRLPVTWAWSPAFAPVTEPGLSDGVVAKQRWMLGLRLEEIDGTVLTHRLSKSLRGRRALAEAGASNVARTRSAATAGGLSDASRRRSGAR